MSGCVAFRIRPPSPPAADHQFIIQVNPSSSIESSQAPRRGRVIGVVRNGKVIPLDGASQTSGNTLSDGDAPSIAPEPTSPRQPAAKEKVATHRTVMINNESPRSTATFKRTSERAASQNEQDAAKVAKGPQYLNPGKLRFGAALYVLGRVLVYSTILATCYLAVRGNDQLTLIIALPIAALVVILCSWIAAANLRCRVCTMPFMRKQKCKMSPKAPKLPLASHQFTFAVHTLCHNDPRCPYCGTINRLRK